MGRPTQPQRHITRPECIVAKRLFAERLRARLASSDPNGPLSDPEAVGDEVQELTSATPRERTLESPQ